MKELLKNNLVRYGLVLIAGIAIGAVFYPSKTIETELEQKYQQQITRLQEEHREKKSELQEQIQKQIAETKEVEQRTEAKLSSVKEENSRLKRQVKERTLKIIKPDGTIVEETYKESQTEVVTKIVTEIRQEFVTKVNSIEKKWEKVHVRRLKKVKEKFDKKIEEKDKVIASLKKSKKVEINKRDFAIAAGLKTDQDYYVNGSYSLFGPFFLNFHAETNKRFDDQAAGIGFGIGF